MWGLEEALALPRNDQWKRENRLGPGRAGYSLWKAVVFVSIAMENTSS